MIGVVTDRLTEPLVLLALSPFLAVVAVWSATLIISIRENRRDRRRVALTDRLRNELFDRLWRDDPQWGVWVTTLTPRERDALEPLVKSYLRELVGAEWHRLWRLAIALGIRRRAREQIHSHTASTTDRIWALTWLALLEDQPEYSALTKTCTDDPTLRVLAARVCCTGDAEDTALGTALLLWDGDTPLSVFGLDTLYFLNRGAQPPLAIAVALEGNRYTPSLTIQIAHVFAQMQTTAPTAAFDWLLEALEADSPAVRIAAVEAITAHSWQPTLRTYIDVPQLLVDPDPRVRRATYTLLATWGDCRSRAILTAAATIEPDDRSRLAAVQALFLTGGDRALEPLAVEGSPALPAIRWVTALAETGPETAAGTPFANTDQHSSTELEAS